MSTQTHADAVFHDRTAMNRAVHGLIDEHVVPRKAIHVSQAMMAGHEVLPAPPQRSIGAVAALIGAIVGAGLSFSLLLVTMFFYGLPAQALLVVLAGAGFGALLAVIGSAIYDPQRGAISSAASSLYRDFLVSVDVVSDRQLERVQQALAHRGGELVAVG
jgi:hypothetical protein